MPNAQEGYVSWEKVEAIGTMASGNIAASRHHGAPEHGNALLAIVSPGAISAATTAGKEAGQRRDQVRDALNRGLEAARYPPIAPSDNMTRSIRQIDLSSNELESRWNKALMHVAEVESKIAAHHATLPAIAIDPVSLASLASHLKTVWTAPTTDARLKERIVRTVIQEVVADIDTEAAEIVLVVHWAGGIHSEMRLSRRPRGQRNSTSLDVIAAVWSFQRLRRRNLWPGLPIFAISRRTRLRPTV
jgi:hypothetical protein